MLNVNADSAAAALAVALGAAELVVLTDVDGPVLGLAGPDQPAVAGRRRRAGACCRRSSGMAPKMAGCLRAVRGGVPRAYVIDGRRPHALLVEMLTNDGTGTMVVP